jgi:hypothetical protein
VIVTHPFLYGDINILFPFFPLLTQEAKEKEDVCADENTDKYLNKKDVQKALHAKLVGIDKWSLCSK